MQATSYDTPIFIDAKSVTQDAVYGAQAVTWASISGARPIFAQWQDVLPSRDEREKRGLEIAARQARVRFAFLTGIDTSMRVRVNRGLGDETWQIIGGPALIGARQEAIEIMVEKQSS